MPFWQQTVKASERCFYSNFLVMTFTINDVIPVHFSNQHDELMNHAVVSNRGFTLEYKGTTRK